MNRILSLVPSATEIVAALGLADRLVGRTHECDYPASILGAEIVTASRIDAARSSSEIDQSVRTALAAGESLFMLDVDAIRRLNPDLILTQGLCRVCAIDCREVDRLAATLPSRPTVVQVQPMTLADVFGDIVRIGDAAGASSTAAAVVANLQERVDRVSQRAAARVGRPKVLLLEWLDPFFSAGHWNPELIELAGGQPVLAETGTLSKTVTLEQIAAADPDLIVLAACGFSRERTIAELPTLERNPEWRRLRAVETGHCVVLNGSHFFNRPGPRLVDSLERLSDLIDAYTAESDSTDIAMRGTSNCTISNASKYIEEAVANRM